MLLVRTSDLCDLQARLTVSLMQDDLPDGLSVGRASGSPLDMHKWPKN